MTLPTFRGSGPFGDGVKGSAPAKPLLSVDFPSALRSNGPLIALSWECRPVASTPWQALPTQASRFQRSLSQIHRTDCSHEAGVAPRHSPKEHIQSPRQLEDTFPSSDGGATSLGAPAERAT